MIDHRCVPDLLHGLYFLGRVIRVLYLKGGFDFEGVERARSGRDAFLRDHLRGARALPAKSGRAVEIGGFERPGFAHRQWWSNAAAVIGRIPPDAVGYQIPGKIEGLIAGVGIAELRNPGADLGSRDVGHGIGDGRFDVASNVVPKLVGPMVAGLRIFHALGATRRFASRRGCRGWRLVGRRLGRQGTRRGEQADGREESATQQHGTSLVPWHGAANRERLPQDEAPKMPEPKIERKYFVIFSRSLS